MTVKDKRREVRISADDDDLLAEAAGLAASPYLSFSWIERYRKPRSSWRHIGRFDWLTTTTSGSLLHSTGRSGHPRS